MSDERHFPFEMQNAVQCDEEIHRFAVDASRLLREDAPQLNARVCAGRSEHILEAARDALAALALAAIREWN